MKLALYLPNFRDKVTVTELTDLTNLAEELDFDSVWTLDRIVVPEASDRQELQYSFGMMDEFPKALPVSMYSAAVSIWLCCGRTTRCSVCQVCPVPWTSSVRTSVAFSVMRLLRRSRASARW